MILGHQEISILLCPDHALSTITQRQVLGHKFIESDSTAVLCTGSEKGPGGGGVTWVNFCWVCAAGLPEPLPHFGIISELNKEFPAI